MTENELYEALVAAMQATPPEPEGAFTTHELVAALGRNERIVRALLGDLIAAGRAECVRVERVGIDGVRRQRPAWRLRAA